MAYIRRTVLLFLRALQRPVRFGTQSGTKTRVCEAGNVFALLFGGVALVGVLGATTMQFIRGPLTTAVNVNRQTVAESNMMTGMQLTMTTSANNPGDCDGDTLIEPVPYKSAGGDPAPSGGGHIPDSIGASKSDPWGTEYGYCVWDHGANNEGDCGGTTENRLSGGNVTDAIALAIISAGKDKSFQTSCNAYVDTSPADGEPDTPLVDKPGSSDDVIFTRTYAEAGSSTGGIWEYKSGNPNTATLKSGAENIETSGKAEFGQSSSTFDDTTQKGVLFANQGLVIGTYDVTTPSADAPSCGSSTNKGLVIRDSGDGNKLKKCNGSSWTKITGAGAAVKPVFDKPENESISMLDDEKYVLNQDLTASYMDTTSTMSWQVDTPPSNGTLYNFPYSETSGISRTPADEATVDDLRFEPNNSYTGTDSFTISINANGESNTKTFNVNVNTEKVRKPDNTSPLDGAAGVGQTPTLESSAFAVLGGGSDTHKASQWQIIKVGGSFSSPLHDSGETLSDLTQYDVPSSVLNDGKTDYAWRLRHRGNSLGWSEWSDATTFTTMSTFPVNPTDCSTSMIPGCEASNGSFYIGDSPRSDENEAVYMTDQSHEVNKAFSSAQDGDGSVATHKRDGRINTKNLVADAGTYEAASYCANLTAHSKSDWYLPSSASSGSTELNLIWDMLDSCDCSVAGIDDGAGTGPSESTDGDFYWGSKEFNSNNANGQRFSDGQRNNALKNQSFRVRCVRRENVFPNSYNFKDDLDVAKGQLIYSNTQTINGISRDLEVKVSSPKGDPQLSINGGTWQTLGTISNGDSLQIRMSSSTVPKPRTATIEIGPASQDTWTIGPVEMTLNNCGSGGASGPSQSNCDNEYSSNWWKDDINVVGTGKQEWTVPFDGTYRITAKGAQASGSKGGRGAIIKGDFTLSKGTKIRVLVGQMANDNYAGAGGTFVVKPNPSTESDIYVIAGGGGGLEDNTSFLSSTHGTSNNCGQDGHSTNTNGGCNGNGGSNTGDGSGGGGIWSDGGDGWEQGGNAYVNGGEGGPGGGYGGGGGASTWGPSGAGGYSGGGGDCEGDTDCGGGGGGSYNNGSNKQSQTGASNGNTGHGEVFIKLLSH